MNEQTNVVPFTRVSTFRDDGGNTGNWLKDMKVGTRFLASRNSDNSSELIDFVVASDPKTMPAIYLGRNINSPKGRFDFVRPDKFVRDYTFFMTLEVIEPSNGDDNQVHSEPVVSDASDKKQSRVHARKQRVPAGPEPGKV